MAHKLVLTTPADRKVEIYVEKQKTQDGPVYAVVGCEDFASLAGETLAFDTDAFPVDTINLDWRSDSYSCFKKSEAFMAPDVSFADGSFKAPNLSTLQSRLNRLKGQFINAAEY